MRLVLCLDQAGIGHIADLRHAHQRVVRRVGHHLVGRLDREGRFGPELLVPVRSVALMRRRIVIGCRGRSGGRRAGRSRILRAKRERRSNQNKKSNAGAQW